MNYPTIPLAIGLEHKIRFFHVSDTHLLFSDGRDKREKFDIAMRRVGEYVFSNVGRNMTYWLDSLLCTKHFCDMMLHTGDLIDFYSQANLEAAAKLLELADIDYFMCAGNHEYTNYSGQYEETEQEIAEAQDQVPRIFRNNINRDSRQIGGLNLIAINNGNHKFTQDDCLFFKAEAERGLPMLLLIHCPVYTAKLAQFLIEIEGGKRLFLCGCPDTMPWPEVKIVTPSDAATKKFIDTIKKEPNLKAVLAGHVHAHSNYSDELRPGLPQFVAGGGYYGCAEIIEAY